MKRRYKILAALLLAIVVASALSSYFFHSDPAAKRVA
jgi:hypothetical protein